MAEEKKEGEKKEAEAPAAEAAPKAGKNKTVLLVAGVIGLLVVIGVPVFLFAFKAKPTAQNETEIAAPDAAEHESENKVPEGAADEDEHQEGEEPIGGIFPLDTFVVNLVGGTTYIRLQVQIEFNDRDVPKRFYSRLVPIRDGIITLLTQKRAEDLIEQKGKDGLRVEIRDLINETLRKQEVKHIFFTQFVIQ